MPEQLGRVRACSECRWQKLKCDARKNPGHPCSRCRKMGFVCEVSRNMRKTQRKTKAELARENAMLQEQLGRQDQPNDQADPPSMTPLPDPVGDVRVGPTPISSRADRHGEASPNVVRSPVAYARTTEGAHHTTKASYTSSVSLDVDQVGKRKIAECFALFFELYEPFIPGIFVSGTSPEQYYDQSPFLFWTIVATGARSFGKDPTLYERVVRQIQNIGTESLFSMTNTIPTIEAVLLLCLWPAPVSTMWKDPTHALAGAAMQLALVSGLHVFDREQDFVRQSIVRTGSEIALRLRLWIHCVTIFQSTNLLGGFPHWPVPEPHNLDSLVAAEISVPPYLLYRYRLHRIQIDAIEAITRNTQLIQRDCGQPLNSMIELFDSQVRGAVPPARMKLGTLTQACVRLSIKIFHLFAAPDSTRTAGLVELYAMSCNLIDMSFNLEQNEGFALSSTLFYMRMLMLAAMCILRISRSDIGSLIDTQHGEAAYFNAIAFAKKRSTETNDLDSRYCTILTQLWTSNTVFRTSNGLLRGDQLQLRSRLFMSVAFDSFWHWRANFGGWPSNPYAITGIDESLTSAPKSGANGTQNSSTTVEIIPVEGWAAQPVSTAPILDNLPVDFDYFPNVEWWTDVSFVDPMPLSLPNFDGDLDIQNQIS